ncbi:MAG: recombination mediator RecR [Microgenomates group bacterium]|jgi:recombination protein RecR|nr:recombination protein RecR [Candidatus Woesebacteria bacterium]QQR64235.1 MAG: recombination protein RecR [Candidatus Roizmanbacteria bacterium]
MAGLPSNLKHIAYFLQRLPGIGEKTANRLAFYFLRLPQQELKELSENILQLKEKTKLCVDCKNLTEFDRCSICENPQRDKTQITVVEDVLDLLSFETGNIYNGVYHVLHGKIDPLNNIGPDDLHIDTLFERVKGVDITEVVLATNLDMEGEATSMYIKEKLKLENAKRKTLKHKEFKVTRLAYGLPMGSNLEYADYMTLKRALEGRNEY